MCNRVIYWHCWGKGRLAAKLQRRWPDGKSVHAWSQEAPSFWVTLSSGRKARERGHRRAPSFCCLWKSTLSQKTVRNEGELKAPLWWVDPEPSHFPPCCLPPAATEVKNEQQWLVRDLKNGSLQASHQISHCCKRLLILSTGSFLKYTHKSLFCKSKGLNRS